MVGKSGRGQAHGEARAPRIVGGIQLTACVSLFRGINVGGNHIVPMSELKSLHEALGFRDVVTYIQSGNVVFSSDEADPAQIANQIEENFAQKFGFRSQVIVRTLAELKEAITNNPFQNPPEKESKSVLVLFLATRPESSALVCGVEGFGVSIGLFANRPVRRIGNMQIYAGPVSSAQ